MARPIAPFAFAALVVLGIAIIYAPTTRGLKECAAICARADAHLHYFREAGPSLICECTTSETGTSL